MGVARRIRSGKPPDVTEGVVQCINETEGDCTAASASLLARSRRTTRLLLTSPFGPVPARASHRSTGHPRSTSVATALRRATVPEGAADHDPCESTPARTRSTCDSRAPRPARPRTISNRPATRHSSYSSQPRPIAPSTRHRIMHRFPAATHIGNGQVTLASSHPSPSIARNRRRVVAGQSRRRTSSLGAVDSRRQGRLRWLWSARSTGETREQGVRQDHGGAR